MQKLLLEECKIEGFRARRLVFGVSVFVVRVVASLFFLCMVGGFVLSM